MESDRTGIAFKIVASLLLCFYTTGCMTIFGKQNEKKTIFFDANVEGVEVNCEGQTVTTPGGISLKVSKSHYCVASKPGYEDMTIRVPSGFSGSGFGASTAFNLAWAIWTLGIGLILGWAVDGLSGAMKDFKRNNFYLEMIPAGKSTMPEKVLEKTIIVTKAAVRIPKAVVEQTAQTVVDTTVREGAEQLGFSSQGLRKLPEESIESVAAQSKGGVQKP
jgi:hypothetical protein